MLFRACLMWASCLTAWVHKIIFTTAWMWQSSKALSALMLLRMSIIGIMGRPPFASFCIPPRIVIRLRTYVMAFAWISSALTTTYTFLFPTFISLFPSMESFKDDTPTMVISPPASEYVTFSDVTMSPYINRYKAARILYVNSPRLVGFLDVTTLTTTFLQTPIRIVYLRMDAWKLSPISSFLLIDKSPRTCLLQAWPVVLQVSFSSTTGHTFLQILLFRISASAPLSTFLTYVVSWSP